MFQQLMTTHVEWEHHRPSRDWTMYFRKFTLLGFAIVSAFVGASHAAALPTFTNVTTAAGITHVHAVGTTSSQFMSAGVAVADFDGDNLVDLFFTQVNAVAALYRNTGSGFQNVSAAAGFTEVLPMGGVAAGDIDNDGDADLTVMGMDALRHYLFVNDGAGHFIEDAIARGADVSVTPGNPTRRGQGIALGDYDGDGYLDIMTSEHGRPTSVSGSRLLRNMGAANPGHFEDVTQSAGLNVYRRGLHDPSNAIQSYRFQPQFTDLDHDGHTDIVISSDERTSQLFWNNGDGTFTDGTDAAGVGTDKSGMGTALGDYDGDGDLDWFITAIYDTTFLGVNPGNRLYRNNGNRTFTDVTTAAGVRNSGSGSELSWGWGTAFLDYDNDARLDLMMTNGCNVGCQSTYLADDTTLRRNNGDGTFSEVTATSGITDTGQGRGLVQLDYDNDGDPDALVVNYGAAPILYRNDGGNSSNWINVKTQGTLSNRDGIGAWITLVPDADHPEQKQVAEVRSGESYLSQSELTAHFGLGSLTGTVDLIEVVWPKSGLVQHYVELPVNSTLMAVERLLGDYDGNSIVDTRDYVVWRNSAGATGVGLAADGAGPNGSPDGIVDNWDYRYWRANFGLSLGAVGSSLATATVPEPASLGTTTILFWATVFGRGLRRRRFQ